MKPELRFERTLMKTTPLGAETSVPDLLGEQILQNSLKFELDEYAELYEGYGRLPNAFPYRQYASYTRTLKETNVQTAVLENDYLKAVFLPEYGGRLWSLVDKKAGRNLLYTNDVIRFSNLAVRNAWFSGGVEWNMGVIGHTPYTAVPLYTAQYQTESGSPVLRMYEYERIRNATYQMDFWLEADSLFLNCRMRIVNGTADVIPMYWWSNIAVPEYENGRIIVPAETAFTSAQGIVRKTPIPVVNGVDITDYKKIPEQVDYFFEIPESCPKFIANLDAGGYGLLQISTGRLKSRKLFSWGNNDASDRWQEFLTQNAGRYVEIQAGLGKTQYGCLPMAPHTAWEWLEQYGAISVDASLLNETHEQRSQALTEKFVSEQRTEELEQLLLKTRPMAAAQARLVQAGSGYGALADIGKAASHLEFVPDKNLQDWKRFSETHELREPSPDAVPDAFFADDKTFCALRRYTAAAGGGNWYARYQLGIGYFIRNDLICARRELEQSLSLKENAWSLHALACTELLDGSKKRAASYILRGLQLRMQDVSYLKEGCKILHICQAHAQLRAFYESLGTDMQHIGRLKFYYISALGETGEKERAFELLEAGGGLEMDDIREGDVSVADLWEHLYRSIHGCHQPVPHGFNFRSL